MESTSEDRKANFRRAKRASEIAVDTCRKQNCLANRLTQPEHFQEDAKVEFEIYRGWPS